MTAPAITVAEGRVLDEEAVQAFMTGVRGPVLRQGDPRYDEARALRPVPPRHPGARGGARWSATTTWPRSRRTPPRSSTRRAPARTGRRRPAPAGPPATSSSTLGGPTAG